MVAGVELDYNTNASAIQMAETIMGNGVTVVDASYTGSSYSSAIYSNGDTVSDYVTPGDTGVIFSTGSATRFTNDDEDESNLSSQTSVNSNGPNGDPGFNALVGGQTFDASYIDIDFIADPNMDTMTMQFVFSSDEYPEYSNSIYNDTVGVWINGVNVPLAVGDGSTAVQSVNQNNNINLYNDNTQDQYNTEMDGFTITMTLTIPITPGGLNSIRIGIADTADSNYDSNLLIAADSVQAMLVADQDYVTMREGVTKTVDILGNDVNNTTGSLVITHINGIEVNGTDPITLPTGQIVVVNPDGTIDITTDADFEVSSFTYQIDAVDSNGDVLETDVGFVTVETIPCFVAGTMIETDTGPRPVEALVPGDLVLTRDDGLQPLRWTGQRQVPATGKMAPIRIAANALGQHDTVMLSPLHRVMVSDAMAELMFGEAEVLVAARDLVNDTTIRPAPGGEVTYVHLLFDQHQVIYSDGLATESFLPGPQTSKSFEAEIVDEICTLFPELDPVSGDGYGPAVRPLLKRYEAEALLRRVA
ncbi:MAG: Hint domain-containing protein [Pseudomonadota bacterium]